MSLRVDIIVQIRRDCLLTESLLVCFDARCLQFCITEQASELNSVL